MPTIELPCTATGCSYITPKLSEEYAFQQMNHHRADVHQSTVSQHKASAKPEKVGRPNFDLSKSIEKWEYFKTRWTTYKEATALEGSDIQIQLMETCSEELRFALFQHDSAINTRSEDTILTAMKKLSVKEENQLVCRMTLSNINQESDEPIRNYAARLKGKADLCGYVESCTKCNEKVRFTSQIVRDNLVRGLYNQDIQREILGLENQSMDLEDLLKLLEAKEAGRRTQASILSRGTCAASSYKQNERKANAVKNENCNYCGRTGHGKNDARGITTVQNRRQNCSAFDFQCKNCSRKGHFTQLCRTKKDSKRSNTTSQGAVAAISDDAEQV